MSSWVQTGSRSDQAAVSHFSREARQLVFKCSDRTSESEEGETLRFPDGPVVLQRFCRGFRPESGAVPVLEGAAKAQQPSINSLCYTKLNHRSITRIITSIELDQPPPPPWEADTELKGSEGPGTGS